jgi:hypothetical protein
MQTTIDPSVGDMFIFTTVCISNCSTFINFYTCSVCNSLFVLTFSTGKCVSNTVAPNCIILNDDKLKCHTCGTNYKNTFSSGKCVLNTIVPNCSIYLDS